ncbi:MAG TPA: OmpA family protein [Longimicrobiales bacterium]|nr:OmpA family protein [Longimicrobiales bacterium]
MRILTIMAFTLAAAIAAPAPAAAQDITKKMKLTAKQRLKTRTAQTEEKILQQTGNAVDSAMAPAAGRVDSAVSAAGSAAAGLPRLLGEAVGAGGDTRRIREALKEGRAVLPEIAFVPGSAQLEEKAERYLMALAEAMEELGGSFLIESHVEPGGKAAAAQALSKARAAAVKAWLIEDGLGEGSLFVVGTRAGKPGAPDAGSARIEVARID